MSEQDKDTELRAIDAARQTGFAALVEDADGDEDVANVWFTRMIVDAFAQHLMPGGPAAVVAMAANAQLSALGSAWRLKLHPEDGAP
jgi:hypothetical protein